MSDDERDNALAAGGVQDPTQDVLDKNAAALTALSLAIQNLQAHAPDAVAARSSKMEKLYGFLIKHNRLRDFKPTEIKDVYEWLQQFDKSVESIANAGCGLDLATSPLSDAEFIKLIKIKISYQVESEILQDLRVIQKDWTDATQQEVRQAMINLYMTREPPICAILKMFAPDRLKKNDLSMQTYYAKWRESLSPILICHTEAEKALIYDLLMRASLFFGINDPYIQKEISSIKEENQSLHTFLQEAIAAEARSIHYKETVNKGAVLDASASVFPATPVVTKGDYRPTGRKRGNRHRGHGKSSQQSTPAAAAAAVTARNTTSSSNSVPTNQNHNSTEPSNRQQSRTQSHGNGPATYHSNNTKYHFQNRNNHNAGARAKVTCFYCHKLGHTARDCRKKAYDSKTSAAACTTDTLPQQTLSNDVRNDTYTPSSNNDLQLGNQYYYKKVEFHPVTANANIPNDASADRATATTDRVANLQQQ